MVWYYFRHLLGFAIQIFGAMALCFIPWDRGSYRYSTKIIFPCFALAVIAFSALFPLPLMTVEGDEQRQVVANMYMLGAVLVCCVAYFALIKEHAVKKLLVVNLAVVYAVVQFITVNLVTVYSNGAVDGSVYSPMDFYGYCVTTVIYFPVTAAIMQRVVKRYLKNADPSLMMREFLCVFILSLVYIVTLIVYYSIIMADSSTAYDHFWYVCIPFLFSAVVLVVFYWAILRELQQPYHKRPAAKLYRQGGGRGYNLHGERRLRRTFCPSRRFNGNSRQCARKLSPCCGGLLK